MGQLLDAVEEERMRQDFLCGRLSTLHVWPALYVTLRARRSPVGGRLKDFASSMLALGEGPHMGHQGQAEKR